MVLLSKHSTCFRKVRRINRSAQMWLLILLIFIDHSFGVNVTVTFEEEYFTSEEKKPSTFPVFNLFPEGLLRTLKWRLSTTDLYMAHCDAEEDCDAGIRMICNSGKCVCKTDDLFFEWPKYGCFSKAHMFGLCEVSGQCVAMNSHTYCNPDSGRCTCSPNYFYNGRECSIRYDGSNLKAQEVYKAAVVAAACFIVAVVGIFVACIVRRSFCRRDQHLQQSDSNRDGDIFSISDEIAALRAVDKPPSYEEVLQIERTFYGIPPPEYSAPRSSSVLAPFHSPSVPPLCLSIPSDYLPPPEAHNSAVSDSTSREYLKDSNQETISVPEHCRDSLVPEDDTANFLAAVDVLPPPSDGMIHHQISAPSTAPMPVGPSHFTHSHYMSSTPPPRLHRLHMMPASSSSSLPGSPNLNSISSQIRVLNLPNPFRKDLLKKNFEAPEPGSSTQISLGSDSVSSELDVPNSLDVRSLDSSHVSAENNSSQLAYDNLGFVSDLHV